MSMFEAFRIIQSLVKGQTQVVVSHAIPHSVRECPEFQTHAAAIRPDETIHCQDSRVIFEGTQDEGRIACGACIYRDGNPISSMIYVLNPQKAACLLKETNEPAQ